MKKLTAEEAANIVTRPAGYGSMVRLMLLSLKPGEFLLIENKDWKWKSQTPITYCSRLGNRSTRKFECARVADGSGWLAKRVS